jgi:alpha-beta hydrolase superfamily lysophospholipase
MTFADATTLHSPTGAALALRYEQAASPVRAVVHVLHGLAEHSGRYGRFAKALAAQGFHVYAHDHRGHGLTRAPDAAQGRFAAAGGADRVLEDVAAVQQAIADRHPGLPRLLFGHSMGSIIALNFVQSGSAGLAGAATWNINVSPGVMGRLGQAILAWEKFRLGSDVASRMLPRLTFQDWNRRIPNARTAFDWLSRDPDEVRKYVEDPLCGWDASISLWQDLFQLVFRGADDRNFASVRRDLPIQLRGGGGDPSTVDGQTVTELAERMRRMGFANLDAKVWPQVRHESLNELDRDAATGEFAAWASGIAGRP